MKTFKYLMALLLVLGFAGSSYAQAGIVERQFAPSTLLRLQGGLEVRNETSATLAAGSIVYVSGISVTAGQMNRWLVTKADADAAPPAEAPQLLIRDTCYNATNCFGYVDGTLLNVNTNGSTIGNPVYLSATAGTWTLTAPTASNAAQIIVGRVLKVSSTIGQVKIDLRHAITNKLGNQALQPGAMAETIKVRASTNLANGDLIYLSSYNATDGAYIAAVADADIAIGQAMYVMTGTVASGSTGTASKIATISGTGISTTGSTVGNPVYLTVTGTTTNSWSLTPPSGADDQIQIVGRVTVVGTGADDGAFLVNLGGLPDHVPTLAQGFILRGSASGVPEAYDANDAAKLLLGDGTTIASVSMSGDATITSAGAITISDAKVEYNDLNSRSAAIHFNQPPMMVLSDMSAVASVGAAATNQLNFGTEGTLLMYNGEAIAAALLPVPSATGMNFVYDMGGTDNDNVEIRAPQYPGGRQAFTAGTDAFYFKVTGRVEDTSGVDPFCVGLMTAQAAGDIDALADIGTTYGDAGGDEVVAICFGAAGAGTTQVLHIYSRYNGAAAVDTASTDVVTDATEFTFEIDVAATGAVTYKLNGTAVTGAVGLTLAAGVVYPFVEACASADLTTEVKLKLWEAGLQ